MNSEGPDQNAQDDLSLFAYVLKIRFWMACMIVNHHSNFRNKLLCGAQTLGVSRAYLVWIWTLAFYLSSFFLFFFFFHFYISEQHTQSHNVFSLSKNALGKTDICWKYINTRMINSANFHLNDDMHNILEIFSVLATVVGGETDM